ncbi:MAG: hypothetical protein ACOYOL_00640 [Chthoniobacterales bacterium]|jgi:hypothetical protein
MQQMFFQLCHLAAPVLALAVMCTAHAIWCRRSPEIPGLNALAGSGLAGLVALGAIQVALLAAGQSAAEVVLAGLFIDAPIYGCLAYGYANFVNLGQSSVRIRIYRELLAAGQQGLSARFLRGEYDEAAMLKVRLSRLVAAGDLADHDGTYTLGRRRLWHIGSCVFGLKKIVLGRHTEFSS